MDQPLPLGSALPRFEGLKGIDGKTHSSGEYTDQKAAVIVFSCNHCPYVQAYEDRMMAFVREYGAKGVRFVAINANDTQNYPEDDFRGMVERAAKRGFNFPYLRDEDQSVAEAFGATHTPEFYVFAPSGPSKEFRLAYRGKLDDNYQDPKAVKRRYLQEAADAILSGQPVPEPETHSIGCTIKWRT